MRLTQVPDRPTCQSLFRTSRPGQAFNANEEHMGSIPYGNANPMTLIGLALSQDIEIGRAGYGRVRVGDRA